jgi:putative ABC transport system ATP-binding protein
MTAQPGGPPIIRIRDLTFRWRPDADIVLSIDRLDVRPGERLFVAGPSGSGKTTLLNLLSGVTTTRQGRVEILGRPLEEMGRVARDRFRADHIGYIFQMFNLIPYLSVVENVTLPCLFSRRRRQRTLERRPGRPAPGSLTDAALRLLDELDMAAAARAGRPVTELSVGQQQRVAAARALIGSPEILIADEPTSALDQDRREIFVRLLFEECGQADMTLIFVSHDTTLAPLFDRTLRLGPHTA